jgi:predicted CoA-binding protein
VFAVSPNAETVEGDPSYASLRAIPGGVETVVIGTRPSHAVGTVHECADLGFKLRLDLSLRGCIQYIRRQFSTAF